jgi:hypothetical protein
MPLRFFIPGQFEGRVAWAKSPVVQHPDCTLSILSAGVLHIAVGPETSSRGVQRVSPVVEIQIRPFLQIRIQMPELSSPVPTDQ